MAELNGHFASNDPEKERDILDFARARSRVAHVGPKWSLRA